jgi:hypothetical protein
VGNMRKYIKYLVHSFNSFIKFHIIETLYIGYWNAFHGIKMAKFQSFKLYRKLKFLLLLYSIIYRQVFTFSLENRETLKLSL